MDNDYYLVQRSKNITYGIIIILIILFIYLLVAYDYNYEDELKNLVLIKNL
jgi:hypothetical protein